MTTTAEQIKTNIDAILPNLQTFAEKQGEMESDLVKGEAKLAAVKQNIAAMRAEFNEIKRAHDDILKKAHAEQAKLEKLEGEVKKKSKELAARGAALSGLPDLAHRLERLDAEFRGKAGEVSNLVGELIKTLRQQQGA